MIKRLLSIILAITMVVSLLPTTVFAVEYYGGTISSDVVESADTIGLNADTTIAEGVTFALVASYYQHIEFNYHVLTNYGTITTANSSNEFDGGTFYNYGVCEITGFYNVTVYDLTLSSIALSSGTLSPSFAAGTREYTVTVDNSVTSIDITPTLNTGTGVKSITVNGTTATSGATSTVSLDVGENSIPIVITAGDGSDTTNTYTLTVTRASAADYTITNALFVSAGTLGISQDMLQWSNVDAPGGYKLEIYTESGTQVYTATLTNNYTPASEVLTSSGTYYFTVYALDANGNELSSKVSSVFTYNHTHNYETVVTDPTCTAGGYTTYTCSVCGDSYTADETEATGHSYEAVVTEPTCTTGGYTTYTCSVCGDTYIADETDATGHSWGGTEYYWYSDMQTCTATRTCQNDSSHVEVEYATVTSEITKEATCTEYGELTYKASFSVNWATEQQKATVILATGHSYGDPVFTWASDYTCTATFTCDNDSSHVETVDCDIATTVYEATCISMEATRYTASVTFNGTTYTCDESKTAITGNKTEHNFTEHYDAVAATCTTDGTIEYWYCDSCGKHYAYDSSAGEYYEIVTIAGELAAGHSMTHVESKDATCTEEGNIEYWYCQNCDKYFSDKDGNNEITDTSTITITVTGHSYGTPVFAWESDYSAATATFTCDNDSSHTEVLTATVSSETTAATCTADGEIVYTAKVTFNGTEYTDTQTEPIAASGHTYGEPVFTWNGNTCTATFTCTECGDVQTVDATVTSKNFFGMVTRTAEVTFGSSTYTDTKTTGRSLLTIMANYTSVNNAISKANALNASDYSNFADVTAAINAVQWNLNVLNQSTVNGYAEAIETAIANLKAAELTEETVTINEPIEDTNTETEPDDIEVDDTDEDQNPTTGIALAMLPMAVALAATVANKRG